MTINLGILGLAHGHVSVYCEQWMKMAERPVHLVTAWDRDAVNGVMRGVLKAMKV